MKSAAQSEFTTRQIWFLTAMGLVLGLRELSMTMLNPFISIYGQTLKWSTPLLSGLALGIYGLTNALFQIPYGSWSDRVGRKPVILTGLAQLGLGLLLAFFAQSIWTLIAARALQGSGAVMAIAYSWIGDGVEDDKKGRAMSAAGVIVALGAVIAFAAGPLLYKVISVRYMFLGCAGLIILAFMLILLFIKEDGREQKTAAENFGVQMKRLLTNKTIVLLSVCGFIVNFLSSDMFMTVPTTIKNEIGAGNMWMVFLPAVLLGIAAMKITTAIGDKGNSRQVCAVSFAVMLIGWGLLVLKSIAFTAAGSILCIAGFMCLTAGIPSQMNRITAQRDRGSANGILQTCTFLGFFFGPTAAGLFMQIKLEPLVYIVPVIAAAVGGMLALLTEESPDCA